jgi:tetratricopeptide (TPR) repeat protein
MNGMRPQSALLIRTDPASVYLNLVRIYQQMGRLDEALEAARAAETVVPADVRDNTRVQGLLLSIAQRTADVQSDLNDHRAALASYQRALAMARNLAQADPQNAMWRDELATTLGEVGDQLRATGDARGALAPLAESRDIYRSFAQATPDNAERLYALAMALVKLGAAQSDDGQHAQAVQTLAESLRVARQVRDKIGGEPRVLGMIAQIQGATADALQAAGDFASARAAATDQLAAARQRLEAEPASNNARRQLIDAYQNLAQANESIGERSAALQHWADALAAARASLAAADNVANRRLVWRMTGSMAQARLEQLEEKPDSVDAAQRPQVRGEALASLRQAVDELKRLGSTVSPGAEDEKQQEEFAAALAKFDAQGLPVSTSRPASAPGSAAR